MELPLLLSEPQNNVSWIWACKRHCHTALSDHVCSGFKRFCISPTFQVLKIFPLSYVTRAAALSSQSSLQLSSFLPLSSTPQLYLASFTSCNFLFFSTGLFSSSYRTFHNPLGLPVAMRDKEVKKKKKSEIFLFVYHKNQTLGLVLKNFQIGNLTCLSSSTPK